MFKNFEDISKTIEEIVLPEILTGDLKIEKNNEENKYFEVAMGTYSLFFIDINEQSIFLSMNTFIAEELGCEDVFSDIGETQLIELAKTIVNTYRNASKELKEELRTNLTRKPNLNNQKEGYMIWD